MGEKVIVLVVEKLPEVGEFSKVFLRENGYETICCHTASSAAKCVGAVDAIVTGLRLSGGLDGSELANLTKSMWPERPVLIVTSSPWLVPPTCLADGVITRKPRYMHEVIKWLREVVG